MAHYISRWPGGPISRPLPPPLPLVPDWWPDEGDAWRSEMELEGSPMQQESPEYDDDAQGDAGSLWPVP